MVDLIVRTHGVVPPLDHFFVHFLNVIPWAHRRTIVVRELADVGVTEVSITGQEYRWHFNLLIFLYYIVLV
jgi:hypothetical protein